MQILIRPMALAGRSLASERMRTPDPRDVRGIRRAAASATGHSRHHLRHLELSVFGGRCVCSTRMAAKFRTLTLLLRLTLTSR